MVIYDGDFKGDSNGDLWWWFMMVIYDGGLWWWFMMVILMVIPMVIYDGDFNGDLWWVVVVTMLNVDHYLIGNFHIPLWKIWTSIRIIIRKLICVPNHQPEDVSIGKSSWPWKTMTSWSPGEPLQISFHLMMESGWWFHPIPKILVSWDDYSNIWKNKGCSKPPTRNSILLFPAFANITHITLTAPTRSLSDPPGESGVALFAPAAFFRKT